MEKILIATSFSHLPPTHSQALVFHIVLHIQFYGSSLVEVWILLLFEKTLEFLEYQRSQFLISDRVQFM